MTRRKQGRAALPSGEGSGRRFGQSETTPPNNTVWQLRGENAAQLRRRRLVERLFHVAGLRGLVELLDEIVRYGLTHETDLEQRLVRYARLNPEIVAVLGGNKLPSLPLRIVRGGR
jgi:hypothetical protein